MNKIACFSFLAVLSICATIATCCRQGSGHSFGFKRKGTDKLLGKGRPGTSLLTDPNGYCTTSAGIKHAFSFQQ